MILPTREPKPDFDPSPDRHARKKWIVQPALDPHMKGVEIDGEKMKFNREGRLVIKDEKKARAVQQKYGMRTAVTGLRIPEAVSDRGHRFFFGQMPAMPWHRFDGEGNRIKED
jgi:hypothetical protein